MKKILPLLFMSLVLAFTSCDDDDNDYLALRIVSSDVDFQADGGSGTIAFKSENAVTVTSDKDWLTLGTPGSESVSYEIAPNNGIIGRVATVTITSNGISESISVSQMGTIIVFEDGFNGEVHLLIDGEGSKTITVESSIAYAISTEEDWFTVETVENKIAFTPKTATSVYREGVAKLTCGDRVYEIEVIQDIIPYEMYIGTYTASYFNDIFAPASSTITVAEKVAGESYTVSGGDFDFSFQMDYRKEDGTLRVVPQKVGRGVYVGDGVEYDIYLGLWGLVDWTAPTISASVSYKGVWDGEAGLNVVFEDGGGWPDGEIDVLNLCYISPTGAYVSDYVGTNAMFIFFEMEKQ